MVSVTAQPGSKVATKYFLITLFTPLKFHNLCCFNLLLCCACCGYLPNLSIIINKSEIMQVNLVTFVKMRRHMLSATDTTRKFSLQIFTWKKPKGELNSATLLHSTLHVFTSIQKDPSNFILIYILPLPVVFNLLEAFNYGIGNLSARPAHGLVAHPIMAVVTQTYWKTISVTWRFYLDAIPI